VLFAELPGDLLGLALAGLLLQDFTPAGWGSFADPSPWADPEFTTLGNEGEANRMDLLTGPEREVGHSLGYEHEANGLMAETLAAGRRLTVRGGDAATSGSSADTLFALLWADEGSAWVGTSSVGRGRRKR
jgi:hypothetical protein